jgi:hypothetical protein
MSQEIERKETTTSSSLKTFLAIYTHAMKVVKVRQKVFKFIQSVNFDYILDCIMKAGTEGQESVTVNYQERSSSWWITYRTLVLFESSIVGEWIEPGTFLLSPEGQCMLKETLHTFFPDFVISDITDKSFKIDWSQSNKKTE